MHNTFNFHLLPASKGLLILFEVFLSLNTIVFLLETRSEVIKWALGLQLIQADGGPVLNEFRPVHSVRSPGLLLSIYVLGFDKS